MDKGFEDIGLKLNNFEGKFDRLSEDQKKAFGIILEKMEKASERKIPTAKQQIENVVKAWKKGGWKEGIKQIGREARALGSAVVNNYSFLDFFKLGLDIFKAYDIAGGFLKVSETTALNFPSGSFGSDRIELPNPNEEIFRDFIN